VTVTRLFQSWLHFAR